MTAVVAAVVTGVAALIYLVARASILRDQWPTFEPTDVIDARELVPTYLDATVQEAAEAAAVVRGWAA